MKNIVTLFLILPILICAQTKKDIQSKSESYITTDLISPFYFQGNTSGFSDNGTPRWRIGYIKNLNQKTKIGIDIGYGNANNSVIQTFDRYSLWEIRPEYYHIINPNRKTVKYISLELFYLNHKEEFENQSFFSEQNEYLTFDRADYNRQKIGLIPKFGMFIDLSNKIGINWYTGVGINYRINSYDNFINLRTRQFDEDHFSSYYGEEGNKIGLEFTIGLKIYCLMKS